MGAHDRIPPDLANSRHSCTVMFVGGAFWNSPLRPDQEGPDSKSLSSSHKRNPRSTTFFQAGLVQKMTIQALFRRHGKANTKTHSPDLQRASRERPHRRFAPPVSANQTGVWPRHPTVPPQTIAGLGGRLDRGCILHPHPPRRRPGIDCSRRQAEDAASTTARSNLRWHRPSRPFEDATTSFSPQ
jgi:hypothetical protein